VLLKRN